MKLETKYDRLLKRMRPSDGINAQTADLFPGSVASLPSYHGQQNRSVGAEHFTRLICVLGSPPSVLWAPVVFDGREGKVVDKMSTIERHSASVVSFFPLSRSGMSGSGRVMIFMFTALNAILRPHSMVLQIKTTGAPNTSLLHPQLDEFFRYTDVALCVC